MFNITIMLTVSDFGGVHSTVTRALIVRIACTSRLLWSLHGSVRFCVGFAIGTEQSGSSPFSSFGFLCSAYFIWICFIRPIWASCRLLWWAFEHRTNSFWESLSILPPACESHSSHSSNSSNSSLLSHLEPMIFLGWTYLFWLEMS